MPRVPELPAKPTVPEQDSLDGSVADEAKATVSASQKTRTRQDLKILIWVVKQRLDFEHFQVDLASFWWDRVSLDTEHFRTETC